MRQHARLRAAMFACAVCVPAFFAASALGLSSQEASHAAGAASTPASASAAAPGNAAPPLTYDRATARQRVAALREVGREMFLDPGLSASGLQSCASCHSPANHFGPPNDLAVQLGGKDMKQGGMRAAPSLEYLQSTPSFVEHFHDSEEEGDESVDAGPTGGLTWDGRVDRGREQARIPLFNPEEMANASPADVIAHVRGAPYAGQLRNLYGEQVFDNTDHALDAVLEAFEAYEQTPATFFPFDSKYDASVFGRAKLTEQEQNGLRLFVAEDKGNCASCHRFAQPGTLPVFNDFGLIALGLPRNPAIPANADPAYHDLGLCGPYRTDLKDHPEYCGLFRSPTLRNVATRKTFFHNGVFHSLREVLEFYVQRDTQPEKYFPRKADGSIDKFDDLPGLYKDNVNMDPPFGGKPGDAPALSAQEIDDVVAFLGTLTDGYRPPAGPLAPEPASKAGSP
jgi:cytochrome c peroxidase